MKRDTIFALASMTKPITAVAVMMPPRELLSANAAAIGMMANQAR